MISIIHNGNVMVHTATQIHGNCSFIP